MASAKNASQPAGSDLTYKSHVLFGFMPSAGPPHIFALELWDRVPSKEEMSAAKNRWLLNGYKFPRIALCSVVGLFNDDDLV